LRGVEVTTLTSHVTFHPTGFCWICGGSARTRFHEAVLDFSAWREQDPELAAYTGEKIWLWRCGACGFAQPERIPALPRFFERMYDQRWSQDWVAAEHESIYKDRIFERILTTLGERIRSTPRTLLDVGCHAGRFLRLAGQAGWQAEGTEINERTAAHAAASTGFPIHRVSADRLGELGRQFNAVTLTDVLEHIPQPVATLATIRRIVADDGWVAVKVPCGPAQLAKEAWRERLRAGYRATLADNLVHISHFSPRALRGALERAGFDDITVEIAAPECPPGGRASAFVRLAVYHFGRLVPGGVHTPLALHLQAFARARKNSSSRVAGTTP
jgi:SAM-dependent methyltransferase